MSMKKKYHVTEIPSWSGSESDEIPLSEDKTEENDPNDEEYETLTSEKIPKDYSYFSTKGTLRQNFGVELAFQNSAGNIVCSPVSALLPLGKLVFGAVTPTLHELYLAIGDHKNKDIANTFKNLIKSLQFVPGVKLDLASKLYISDQAQLVPKYNNDVMEVFGSSVEKISFSSPKHAADEINGWVSRQTNGMIPLLIDPGQLSPMASLVIVNAIYFKGKWQNPFHKVEVGDFYASSGVKKTQLMKNRAVYRYAKSDVLNAQIVEIPYEGMESALVIVLPNERVGLPLLLNQLKLAPNLLNSAMKNYTRQYLDLTVPKFIITSTVDLKDMYEKIGLKSLMGPKSGLTGIVKNETLIVSTGIQKAVIEVHELGTEAAGASALVFATGAAPATITQFLADHPFLFYISVKREQLFSGIYTLGLIALSANYGSHKFEVNHPFLFYIQANAEQLFSGIFSDP